MVLVRTETGQLVMVPQQVLAQAQAKMQQGPTVANITQRPATPTAGTAIRVSTATTVGLRLIGVEGPVYLHLVFSTVLSNLFTTEHFCVHLSPPGINVRLQ